MSYELSVRDYLAVLRRRSWILIIPFLMFSALGAVVANTLPAKYKAQGTILIESQQIPEDLVPSTVTGIANERVRIVQQRVMTRQNLLGIVREFDLYGDTNGIRSQSQKIASMRRNISIDMIQARQGRGVSTFAINVGFEDGSPEMALRVTNELVTLFLDENARTRTQRATETTEFLRGQADDLQQELEVLEAQLATYKQENAGALPEQMSLHLDMLERARTQLRNVENELKSYEGELRFLAIERQAAQNRLTALPPSAPIERQTPQQQLDRLESELAGLRVRYSDEHPDVLALRQQIVALESAIQGSVSPSDSASTIDEPDIAAESRQVDPTIARIETSISMIESQAIAQTEFRERLLRQINDLEGRVSRTPDVELGLGNLTRDLQNTRSKYEELRAKERAAQLSQNLEEDKKAERFILLEPPVRPEAPSSPNRLLVAAVGPVVGGAIGAGLLLLIELLFGRVTRPVIVAKLMDEPPFAVLPMIETEEDIRKKRIGYAIFGAASLVGIAAITATHFLIVPLNDLMGSAISLIA
ncbi:MAG: Wzz/FepE/Etk N-terminal domain-containing protein [Pseudomonadota bacterium]